MRVLEGAHKTLTFNDENQSNVQYIMIELNNNTKVNSCFIAVD